MRKIKILTTRGTSGEVETNVQTAGELRPLLQERGIETSGMKMMVKETRNELTRDDAVLPEGDFKLFLMPAKTKSGSERLAFLYSEQARICAEIAKELQRIVDSEPTTNVIIEEDPDLQELREIEKFCVF